jgi:hypothetical protein
MKKSVHGGRRIGSGRPSFFRGKSAKAKHPLYKHIPPATQLLLTMPAFDILLKQCAVLSKAYAKEQNNPKARISRNVFLDGLLRVYGARLSLAQLKKAARHD